MHIEEIAPQFRRAFEEHGAEFEALIDLHIDEMVEFSRNGRPALAALVPHIPLRLVEPAIEDPNAHMVGHLTCLKMAKLGFPRKLGTQEFRWPVIDRVSMFETFGPPESEE